MGSHVNLQEKCKKCKQEKVGSGIITGYNTFVSGETRKECLMGEDSHSSEEEKNICLWV